MVTSCEWFIKTLWKIVQAHKSQAFLICLCHNSYYKYIISQISTEINKEVKNNGEETVKENRPREEQTLQKVLLAKSIVEIICIVAKTVVDIIDKLTD